MIKREAGSEDAWSAALVLVNPDRESMKFQIPKGKWHKFIFNNELADGSVVEPDEASAQASENDKGAAAEGRKGGNTVELKPISSAIFYME